MNVRALRAATKGEADALRAKVDASHGYPRCERLAGRVTHVGGGRHTTECACVDASAPDPQCTLSSRAELLPVELRDLSWVYPVDEAKPETLAALTAAEKDAIVTVADGEAKPVADAVAAEPKAVK